MDKGQARKLAHAHIGAISDNSEHEYKQAFERLKGETWRTYAEAHAATKRTASVLRAAWRRGIAQALLAAVNDTDKAPTPEERKTERVRMDSLARELIADTEMAAYAPPISAARAGAKSKRKSLTRLPHDWREKILENVHEKDRAGVVALMLGARPEETRKGITLTRDGSDVIAVIQGAKIKELSGQEERQITIHSDLADLIIETLALDDRQTATVITEPGQSFQKRVMRAANRQGFKGVTAYSFRHAWAADLKAGGYSPEEIAKALGQQSERTQQHYGTASQGGKGGRSVSMIVEATNETRPNPRQGRDMAQTNNAHLLR